MYLHYHHSSWRFLNLKIFNYQGSLCQDFFYIKESICPYALLWCCLTLALNALTKGSLFVSFLGVDWSKFFTVIHWIMKEVQLRYSFIFGLLQRKQHSFLPLHSLQWRVFRSIIKQSNSSTQVAFWFWRTVVWLFHQFLLTYIYKYLWVWEFTLEAGTSFWTAFAS